MDYSKLRPTVRYPRLATGPSNDVKACALTPHRLTLATLVIAVVSFAGTAFAATPAAGTAQGPVETSASR